MRVSRRDAFMGRFAVGAGVAVIMLFCLGGTAFADPGNGQSDVHASPQSLKNDTTGTVVSDSSATASAVVSHGGGQGGEHGGEHGRHGPPTGRPVGLGGELCTGCVGNADKTPVNQHSPDQNNGFTCDGNQGVGQGNPAHPACDAPPSGSPPPPSGSPTPPSSVPPVVVLGEEITRAASSATAGPPVVEGASLARTGFDAMAELALSGTLLSGGALSLVGARLLRRPRRTY